MPSADNNRHFIATIAGTPASPFEGLHSNHNITSQLRSSISIFQSYSHCLHITFQTFYLLQSLSSSHCRRFFQSWTVPSRRLPVPTSKSKIHHKGSSFSFDLPFFFFSIHLTLLKTDLPPQCWWIGKNLFVNSESWTLEPITHDSFSAHRFADSYRNPRSWFE